MNVRTQSLHFDADQKLINFISKKVTKLETFFDNIIAADVILRLEKNGKMQDKVAEVRLNVPGGTLVARESNKTFEASVEFAVDAVRRQLIKYKEKQQGR